MLRCSGRRRPRVEGENHARFALFPEPAFECRPRVLEVHGADGERDGPCREVLARRRRRRWKRWKRRRRRKYRRQRKFRDLYRFVCVSISKKIGVECRNVSKAEYVRS